MTVWMEVCPQAPYETAAVPPIQLDSHYKRLGRELEAYKKQLFTCLETTGDERTVPPSLCRGSSLLIIQKAMPHCHDSPSTFMCTVVQHSACRGPRVQEPTETRTAHTTVPIRSNTISRANRPIITTRCASNLTNADDNAHRQECLHLKNRQTTLVDLRHDQHIFQPLCVGVAPQSG